MTPFQMYLHGYIDLEQLEKFIDVWSGRENKTMSLHDFLGMGEYLYDCFVSDAEMFNSWVNYRRAVLGL